jgi:hypothetical protein
MAGVIRFVFSGVDKGIQQLTELRKKVNGVKDAGAGKVGGGALARIGAGAGMGQLGQLGSAIGSPLGAVGAAAVGVGLSLRMLKGTLDASITALENEVKTRYATRDKISNAVKSADERAAAAFLAKRGTAGFTDAKSVAVFREYDKVQKQIGAANAERGSNVLVALARQELASVKSPEAVALGEAFKEAQKQTTVQTEIRDSMNWFQKAYEGIANQMQGRSWNARGIDAMRAEAAVTGD